MNLKLNSYYKITEPNTKPAIYQYLGYMDKMGFIFHIFKVVKCLCGERECTFNPNNENGNLTDIIEYSLLASRVEEIDLLDGDF